jgi:hypothetical protein
LLVLLKLQPLQQLQLRRAVLLMGQAMKVQSVGLERTT